MTLSPNIDTMRKSLTFNGHDLTVPMLTLLGLVFSLIVYALFKGASPFPEAISSRVDFAAVINGGEQWLQEHVKTFTRSVSTWMGYFLEQVELFLWFKPWPVVALAMALPALHYGGIRLALFTLFGVMFWGMMDMWDPAMSTLALMSVSVVFSVVFGVMVGVWCSQSNRVEAFVRPILDTMQTMPSFVYLLPAIIFFGIGGPSATMAIIIYAMPPVVRLTNLGIRQVPQTTIEAAESYGSTRMQLLLKVQIPQALPSIMLGINQTIMMALGLAVLAVFIGAGGLGEEVWKALRKLKVGWSFEGGMCIVFMAVIFDRLSLAMSMPRDSGVMVDRTELKFKLLPQSMASFRPAMMFEVGLDRLWRAVDAFCRIVVGLVAYLIEAPLVVLNQRFGQRIGALLRQSQFLVFSILIFIAIFAWDAYVLKIGFFPEAWQFTVRAPIDKAVDFLATDPIFIGFTQGLRAGIYLYLLNPLDQFLIGLPWFFVLAAFLVVIWVSVGPGFAVIAVGFLFFTGAAGLWAITMQTLSATVTSVALCIIIGLPIGVFAAYNRTVDSIVRPILDTMQTMPAFVYLIPVLMFFGGNKVTAIIATVIYALPPMVRMTILGLKQLPTEISEVSNAFGSTERQSLLKVKLPMASPSIMLGVNQAVIMALAMQVITPLVAGEGLGKEVFHAMNTADTGRGLVAGIGIVLLAIILDRLTQAWTKNQREALGL
ncbi:MAG: glycine betaine/proline transport system permease protein [Candidatus Paceibacteria bacterium]|jgi:glycine betaine/proline transport system permease protein